MTPIACEVHFEAIRVEAICQRYRPADVCERDALSDEKDFRAFPDHAGPWHGAFRSKAGRGITRPQDPWMGKADRKCLVCATIATEAGTSGNVGMSAWPPI
jgi:hypothetical protein